MFKDKMTAALALICIFLVIGIIKSETMRQDLKQLRGREKAQALMLDECARKANVYPTSCQLQAVVIKPRLLDAPRVEGAGHE